MLVRTLNVKWLVSATDVFTYPLLHSWFCSSSVLIMLTMISSLTRPPASMIFFASRPSGVLAATCARSMSPVAYIY